MLTALEVPFYDDDFVKLVYRFLHDVVFMVLVVRFAWHPNASDREFSFAAVMLNITVFFICFTMKKLELSLGMALGLFAIFGVLRYRTRTISTKDMTYLFIVIGIAVINALANKKTSYIELLTVNSTILIAAMIGEHIFRRSNAAKKSSQDTEPDGDTTPSEPKPPKQRKQTVTYDSLEMLAPDRYDALLADLRSRTHMPITRARVEEIDLPNSRARLSVWYDDVSRDDASTAPSPEE